MDYRSKTSSECYSIMPPMKLLSFYHCLIWIFFYSSLKRFKILTKQSTDLIWIFNTTKPTHTKYKSSMMVLHVETLFFGSSQQISLPQWTSYSTSTQSNSLQNTSEHFQMIIWHGQELVIFSCRYRYLTLKRMQLYTI